MAKILVVEDEKSLNEAYKLILEKEGYQVDSAFNGQAALTMAEENKYDLILLDLRMPKMNGVEFLKKLKPTQRKPLVKVVIFSNYDYHKEIEDAFKYGASRYILKAWSSPKELIKVVKETLGSKEKVAISQN